MQFTKSMKAASVLGTGAIIVGSAGVAVALWSANGTGSGSATAASSIVAAVTANSTADAALWPGNTTAVPVGFKVSNPNPFPVSYSTFSDVEIDSVTGGSLDTANPCDEKDFTLTGTFGSLSSPVAVAVGAAPQAGTTSNILKMVQGATDNCQGAVVTLTMKVAGAQTS